MDALSCGATVLASRTPPIEEMIREGENGLLADFFEPEDFANKAIEVLKDPGAFRQLGKAGEQMIIEKYSLEAVLPRMLKIYEDVLNRRQVFARTDVDSGSPDEMVTQSLKLKAPRSPFLG